MKTTPFKTAFLKQTLIRKPTADLPTADLSDRVPLLKQPEPILAFQIIPLIIGNF